MASTDLITYLNYMSTWDTESDENIDKLISEQNLFVNLNDFESDSAVDSVFNAINDLACEVRDRTIAADATQMAADAAAVASIWSFGLGMAAFVALEAAEQIEKAVISSKAKELNEKLTTADADISSRIGQNVADYVAKYKENNNLIVSKAPKGLDTSTCRANLMQFMAEVQRNGKLDAATFRQYAESARIVYNSDEINKVYDALDKLNFSAKSDADVKQFMNVLAGLTLPPNAKFGLTLVTSMSIAIMFYKLKIANATIKAQAEEAGLPVEEVDTNAFEAMDAVGKFAAGVAIVMSVVDVVLNIIDIVDVVEQCKKMCDELNTTIKTSYKSYFNGIKTAAQQYRAAIGAPAPSTGKSAQIDVNQMHAQIAQYGSITQFGVRISNIAGTADNPNQSSGVASKTDKGFSGYNGTWEVGNWGDTLKFTS
jgi:hypothetical protein